jgi:hypothetical protein
MFYCFLYCTITFLKAQRNRMANLEPALPPPPLLFPHELCSTRCCSQVACDHFLGQIYFKIYKISFKNTAYLKQTDTCVKSCANIYFFIHFSLAVISNFRKIVLICKPKPLVSINYTLPLVMSKCL